MQTVKQSPQSEFCILLVDDELFSLSALHRLLRTHCYHTISASDPAQALAGFAKNKNIGLVLSDYEMPGMNGVALLREVAAIRPETRRIILSAHTDSAILLEALNDGGVHRYLTKPWSAKELLLVLEEQHTLYLKHAEERSYLQELSHQQQLLTITNQQLDTLIAERTAELVQRKQELQQANLRLRQLTGRLEQLREEERRAIARDIHDDLAQALTSIQLALVPISQDIIDQQKQLQLQQIKQQIDHAISTVQRILADLRPQVLDQLGLVAALEALSKELRERTGIDCRVSCRADTLTLPTSISTCLYRIAQEALTNIRRHSRATKATLRLQQDRDAVILEVQDNGIGLSTSPHMAKTSYGLLGMQERAALCDGSCTITKTSDSGTLVSTRLPLTAKADKL